MLPFTGISGLVIYDKEAAANARWLKTYANRSLHGRIALMTDNALSSSMALSRHCV